jgi:hypothetical protein
LTRLVLTGQLERTNDDDDDGQMLLFLSLLFRMCKRLVSASPWYNTQKGPLSVSANAQPQDFQTSSLFLDAMSLTCIPNQTLRTSSCTAILCSKHHSNFNHERLVHHASQQGHTIQIRRVCGPRVRHLPMVSIRLPSSSSSLGSSSASSSGVQPKPVHYLAIGFACLL